MREWPQVVPGYLSKSELDAIHEVAAMQSKVLGVSKDVVMDNLLGAIWRQSTMMIDNMGISTRGGGSIVEMIIAHRNASMGQP